MSTASARFHLISGNRLDRLAAHLGARLAAPADPDSLAPDVVLIPQPALRHWLQQALAERYGVAANLDICTPSEFVWRLLRSAQPQLPDTSPWDRESLRWQLYALLDDRAASLPPAVRLHLQRAAGASAEIGGHAFGEHAFGEHALGEHALGEHALGEHALGERALARYGLADALAGAYDKYQAYRRDWLQAWERNDHASRDDWQAQLWRALRQRLRGTSHRAVLLGEWLARYDREADTYAGSAPPGLPPRVAAFGTIHVSPDVLHLLAVVGQWSELDFYLPTPSAEYWGDVESLRERLRRDGVASLPTALADAERDNPLLTAWGAGGREILAQLFSYEIVLPQRETELFALPGRDTLLHRLQQDVLDRAAPVASGLDADDISLQLHACHSKLREVEVLHDQLRALLDDTRFDPPLQPRDIAVLAPDIADYLPLARAVFGGLSPDDARFIPFSLADRPQAQSHPLIALLLDLIALADTPLTASAFRDLLATPSIAHALQLDAAQRAKIDAWFEAAGIRWGEDEAARERVGAGRWREYSFDFGIDRLLSGYATGADTAEIDAGTGFIAPYPELEGADADTLDRALTLYRRLRELIAWMRVPHAAADWRARLADTLQILLAPVPQDDSEAQARRLLLDTLDDFANEAEHAGALPATLVHRTLHDTLTQPSSHRPWLSGGVTFAGMVPLRTVPFRVICLLGLDADAYPRREPGDDINRIVDAIQGRAPRRLGDRSVRDDDRFLFLQLLCAAGDVFYLSYGGRDARDGSVREPSPVISELLDAVERMHGDVVRERLCVQHPLQPFSPRAFGAGDAGAVEPRRFSYRRQWAMPAAVAQTSEPPFVATPLLLSVSDDVQAVPDRDALQRFFVNPARDWLRERLGLRLPDATHEIADREPLGENGLLRYGAIDALLSYDEEGVESEAFESEAVESWLRAQALLPPGRDGDAIAQNARVVARDLLAARATAVGTERTRIVSLSAADAAHGIAFHFDDVHDDARAIAVAGRLDGKRRLRAGLDHLLLASVLGERARTYLIGYDSKAKAPVDIVYTGVSQTEADDRLAAMLALWREGRDTPLPFAPKTAFAYAAQWHAKKDVGAAWKAAHAAFAPFGGGGESEDMWLRLAFRPEGLLARFDAAHAPRFREIAVVVFDAREPAA